MSELTDADDAVLQAALDRLFIEHAEAADACDKQAAAECHHAIATILAEQSRRLDEWIELQRAAHA
jgi:hypothetical protein